MIQAIRIILPWRESESADLQKPSLEPLQIIQMLEQTSGSM